MQLLLQSLPTTPGLHPDDLERLRLMADDSTDPADHSRRLQRDPPPPAGKRPTSARDRTNGLPQ